MAILFVCQIDNCIGLQPSAIFHVALCDCFSLRRINQTEPNCQIPYSYDTNKIISIHIVGTMKLKE